VFSKSKRKSISRHGSPLPARSRRAITTAAAPSVCAAQSYDSKGDEISRALMGRGGALRDRPAVRVVHSAVQRSFEYVHAPLRGKAGKLRRFELRADRVDR